MTTSAALTSCAQHTHYITKREGKLAQDVPYRLECGLLFGPRIGADVSRVHKHSRHFVLVATSRQKQFARQFLCTTASAAGFAHLLDEIDVWQHASESGMVTTAPVSETNRSPHARAAATHSSSSSTLASERHVRMKRVLPAPSVEGAPLVSSVNKASPLQQHREDVQKKLFARPRPCTNGTSACRHDTVYHSRLATFVWYTWLSAVQESRGGHAKHTRCSQR